MIFIHTFTYHLLSTFNVPATISHTWVNQWTIHLRVFFFLSPIPVFLEGIGETKTNFSDFPLLSLSQVIHSFSLRFWLFSHYHSIQQSFYHKPLLFQYLCLWSFPMPCPLSSLTSSPQGSCPTFPESYPVPYQY